MHNHSMRTVIVMRKLTFVPNTVYAQDLDNVM